MHSAPYTMRVSSPRMALPGRPLMFWATVTMCGLKCGDSLKELLRMRQVALSGHERNHDLVGTPTAADDGIAKQTKMLVLIKGGNMQPLSFACDAVENLTGTRCLDRTLRVRQRSCACRAQRNRNGQHPPYREQREWRPYGENRAAQDICPGRPG